MCHFLTTKLSLHSIIHEALITLFNGVAVHCSTLCPRVQVSYAIGVAEPLSIFISSYGTGIKTDAELLKIVKANFDLRPGKIVKYVFCISCCVTTVVDLIYSNGVKCNDLG